MPPSPSELLVSSAKADLTLQDAVKNTALHLACSKVCITMRWHSSYILQQQINSVHNVCLLATLYDVLIFIVLFLLCTGT